MVTVQDRPRQHFRVSPALLDAPPKRCGAYACRSARLLKCKKLFPHRDPHGCSLGPVLLSRRRPPAVGGLVIPVIVDSVDGVFRRRTRPHIFIERGEAVPPSVANRDPASTVVTKARSDWVEAPLFHRSPGSPLRRVFHAVPQAVFITGLENHGQKHSTFARAKSREIEVGKRRSLIAWGREKCKW
jgi:hypothetical protein